eukprot:COSAG06_NODE_206_length_20263_cov_29.102559_8_plen_64_part_00
MQCGFVTGHTYGVHMMSIIVEPQQYLHLFDPDARGGEVSTIGDVPGARQTRLWRQSRHRHRKS